ncbi:MAG: 3-deoxy-8-phosphooctulonate synthase [Deltaproteobacteria bacterium]|nr:3-deoxy-8-phosphooctulonate synthase [Deltaproteobacteria bacterium]
MRPSPTQLAPGVEICSDRLPFICGPCAVESEAGTLEAAGIVAAIAQRLDLPLIFKASFDKANRSSGSSFRGLGLEEGLRILALAGETTGLPLLTDIHEPHQVGPAAEVCDVLQIPAFLCRQTDLIVAAAASGRAVNIKKGQFMAPDDMRRAVDKARNAGGERVTVTERGFSFGYHNLVVDMRSFAMMQAEGIPVIFDVTHSLQLPGGGVETGGARQFAEPLARAAVAAGADGIFMEIHPRPEEALSDSTTQLSPQRGEALAASLLAVHAALPRES